MAVYTDWAVGDLVTADNLNTNLVEERLGTTTITTDSAAFTTTETSLASVVTNVTAGQIYKVMFSVCISSSVAADTVNVRIREDSLLGTQLISACVATPTVNAAGFYFLIYAEFTASVTGAKTVVGSAQRNSGTGNINARHSTSRIGYLTVERVMD